MIHHRTIPNEGVHIKKGGQTYVYETISKKTFDEAAAHHRRVEDANARHTEAPWREVVNIGKNHEQQRRRLINKLEEIEEMWYRPLGSITTTTHRIELMKDAKEPFQQPYLAGPARRELERNEIDKVIKADVIEPSTSEWASPVVLR